MVISNEAIDTASWRASLITFEASKIPAFSKSSYSPVCALKPFPKRLISETTTSPLKPAFMAICFVGAVSARFMISTPVLWSPFNLFVKSSSPSLNFRRVVPPPATIPSSIAARVAFKASSIPVSYTHLTLPTTPYV